MLLSPAADHDLDAVAALVNSAYRGDSSRQGWTTEADYLEGQRTDAMSLRHDLATKAGAVILLLREAASGPILGSVWLEPARDHRWYLGMLSVNPQLQARQLGRTLLEGAEAFAATRGAMRMEMTVITIRETLVAWYLRRGYRPTGERRPFPYGDDRFGLPQQEGLEFVVLEKAL